MRTLRVLLRDTTSGVERWYEESWTSDDAGDGGIEYMWNEGNWSCDCNRSLFFARAAGEPDDQDVPCNLDANRFIVVEALLDGRPFPDIVNAT